LHKQSLLLFQETHTKPGRKARLLWPAWEFGQLLGSLVCSWRLHAAPVGMKFAVWWENSFGDGRRG
jgi:hypothetical protein